MSIKNELDFKKKAKITKNLFLKNLSKTDVEKLELFEWGVQNYDCVITGFSKKERKKQHVDFVFPDFVNIIAFRAFERKPNEESVFSGTVFFNKNLKIIYQEAFRGQNVVYNFDNCEKLDVVDDDAFDVLTDENAYATNKVAQKDAKNAIKRCSALAKKKENAQNEETVEQTAQQENLIKFYQKEEKIDEKRRKREEKQEAKAIEKRKKIIAERMAEIERENESLYRLKQSEEEYNAKRSIRAKETRNTISDLLSKARLSLAEEKYADARDQANQALSFLNGTNAEYAGKDYVSKHETDEWTIQLNEILSKVNDIIVNYVRESSAHAQNNTQKATVTPAQDRAFRDENGLKPIVFTEPIPSDACRAINGISAMDYAEWHRTGKFGHVKSNSLFVHYALLGGDYLKNKGYYYLGCCFLDGEGVVKDNERACYYFRQGANTPAHSDDDQRYQVYCKNKISFLMQNMPDTVRSVSTDGGMDVDISSFINSVKQRVSSISFGLHYDILYSCRKEKMRDGKKVYPEVSFSVYVNTSDMLAMQNIAERNGYTRTNYNEMHARAGFKKIGYDYDEVYQHNYQGLAAKTLTDEINMEVLGSHQLDAICQDIDDNNASIKSIARTYIYRIVREAFADEFNLHDAMGNRIMINGGEMLGYKYTVNA